jgi:hypothetical protein
MDSSCAVPVSHLTSETRFVGKSAIAHKSLFWTKL